MINKGYIVESGYIIEFGDFKQKIPIKDNKICAK